MTQGGFQALNLRIMVHIPLPPGRHWPDLFLMNKMRHLYYSHFITLGQWSVKQKWALCSCPLWRFLILLPHGVQTGNRTFKKKKKRERDREIEISIMQSCTGMLKLERCLHTLWVQFTASSLGAVTNLIFKKDKQLNKIMQSQLIYVLAAAFKCNWSSLMQIDVIKSIKSGPKKRIR